jgi:hypothetical protein
VLCITQNDKRRFPDAQVRVQGVSAYLGAGFANTTAVGQTAAATVATPVVTKYDVLVQNLGNLADSVRVTGSLSFSAGPLASSQWVVKVYDATTRADLTAQILAPGAGGWASPGLAIGATKLLEIDVTPTAAAPVSTNCTVRLVYTSTGDTTKSDVAATVTTRGKLPPYRPDALVRQQGDPTSKNVTDNYYSDVDSQFGEQQVSQATSLGVPVFYTVTAQNDGAQADAMTVTVAVAGAGWTVRVYDVSSPMGGGEVTAQVLGAGWTLANLAPGARREFRLELTPTGSMLDTKGSAAITVTSRGDTTKYDVVKANATIPF